MLRKTCIAGISLCLLCGCAGRNAAFSIEAETVLQEYENPESFYQSEEYSEWCRRHEELSENAEDAASRQLLFAQETAVSFLNTEEKANRIYAPLNAWLALAALTACTSGNTRQELLDLLHADSDQQLLSDCEALREAADIDLPEAQEHNAVSLWLSDRYSFRQENLQTMCDQYHLSSFAGNLASGKMKKAFDSWINDHTAGIPEDSVSEMRPDADTAMSLVSALYYKAAWENAFNPRETELQLFHGITKDSEVYLMKMSEKGKHFRGSNFQAVRKKLKDAGYMYIILPDPGLDPADIYTQDEMWQMLQGSTFIDRGEDSMLYIDLPRFDISVQDDLSGLLKGLGVNAVFDSEKADFSEITDDKNLYLSSAEHAAAVSVDENGVSGAAYTKMEAEEGSGIFMGGRYIIEARSPFLFVITGDDGSVRFIGTIYDLPGVNEQWAGQFPGTVEGVTADHTAVLPQGTIHYYLPEGMEAEITGKGELYIYVKNDPDRGMTLSFGKVFDYCTTGMYEETRIVNGRDVWLGSMSSQSWHYAVFHGKGEELNLGIASGLGITYGDMADQILHSIHIEF